MTQGTPSLAQTLQIAMDAVVGGINTALPGRVVRYNAETQRADILPVIRRAVPTPAEDYIPEDLPEIPNVRVMHPGGADWAIHVPVKAGDTVLLVFCQWDIAEWMRTGEVSDPADKRRHSLSHAVALTGFRRAAQTIPNTSADDLTIHSPGHRVVFKADGSVEVDGSSVSAAVASAVASAFADVQATLDGFLPGTGGAEFPVPFAAPSAEDLASSKLKMGG